MRWHLFEWLDQAWLPRPLRDGMRRYLAASYAATPLPALWAEPLGRLLERTAQTTIIDLGSGAAGPMPLVVDALAARGCHVNAVLTDLFPMDVATTAGGLAPRITAWPDPVDARMVPESLDGVRTMFAVFHHLQPADARQVLRDAFDRRRPIAIFEATSRSPAALLLSLVIPLLVLVMTPRIRPLRPSQLLFTYIVPLLPLLILWDGEVSHLRTYSVDELRRLTSDCQAPDYEWEIGTLSARGVPFSVPYLLGVPRR